MEVAAELLRGRLRHGTPWHFSGTADMARLLEYLWFPLGVASFSLLGGASCHGEWSCEL